MQVERIIKRGNPKLLMEWVKEYSPDEEFAALLDEAEKSTRKRLKSR